MGDGGEGPNAAAQQRVRIEWIALALLPLSVASKFLLFLAGRFEVRWTMTLFDCASLVGQELLVWACLFVALSLLAGRKPRRAWTILTVATVNVVLLLQLIDMRCKQLFFQPIDWSTAVEAIREARIVRSSLGLFFGKAFTPFFFLCMAALNLPLPALRLWRRRFGPPLRPLGDHPTAWIAAFSLVVSLLLFTAVRPQPYRLNDDVMTGWLFDGWHASRTRQARLDSRDHCDQKARLLTAQDFGYAPETAPARGRSVILFIRESLSYAASSFGDPARDNTPYLRQLAAGASVVTRCRAQVAWSTKAIYGILSGRYSDPHLEVLESILPRLEGMPRTLSRHGYTTAFLSTQFLSWQNTNLQYRALGFDRVVGAEEIAARGIASGHPVRQTTSWGLDDAVLAGEAEDLVPPDKPFFLVVYDVSSHHPYDYPGAVKTDSNYDRYLKSVRYGDAAMQAVLDRIKPRLRGRDPLIVVVGDHGENIHASSYFVRGCLLAEIEQNVPLVFSMPGLKAAPEAAGARQIDITPTVLDLLGIAPEAPMQGRSLFSRERPPATYLNSYGKCQLAGVVDGNDKQLYDRVTNRAWSFDLATDPGERNPRMLDDAARDHLASRLDACAVYNEMALSELSHP